MLDKSLAYKNIIMEISHQDLSLIPEPALPEGYSFCLFEKGMETDWARIETSVLEFENEDNALQYFNRDYIPFEKELEKRCVFIKNNDDLPIATATAWFSDSSSGYQASLHWVAVHPNYQGLGLGKAIAQKASRLFIETDKDQDVLLHTQTWSHKAILIYLNMGYHFSKDKQLVLMTQGGKEGKTLGNDYQEAIEVLRNVFSHDMIKSISNTSINIAASMLINSTSQAGKAM